MRRPVLAICVALAMALTLSGTAIAGYLDGYDNITIYDGTSNDNLWHGPYEDQEVEPGAATGQEWDLEGFFQNGNSLIMVGGFDFENGEPWGGTPSPVGSGDLFVDITGDAGDSEQADYGYEYVLDLNFDAKTYDVVALDDNAAVEGVFTNFTSSNPYRYSSGGDLLSNDVSFVYDSGLTDADVGLQGGLHNAIKLDLSFLSPEMPFTLHFTQACGNDNLMGHGAAPVPEPATMVLFGTGLLGLAGIGRKNLKRKAAQA